MALASSLPASAQTTELAPGMTASVTAGVNLRAGPGSEHERLTVIPEGAAVVIEECVAGWCEVAYDSINGFVYDDYVDAGMAAGMAAEMAADEWILQTTAVHSLRAGPGAEHAAVAEIPEGAAVAVEECMPGWCEVTYEGISGFIEIVAATPEETSAALAPPAEAGENIARTTGDLNLRAGAGMRHDPITVIPAGATVEIRDCMPDRVWCEVTYGEMTGYASKRYLDFTS